MKEYVICSEGDHCSITAPAPWTMMCMQNDDQGIHAFMKDPTTSHCSAVWVVSLSVIYIYITLTYRASIRARIAKTVILEMVERLLR